MSTPIDVMILPWDQARADAYRIRHAVFVVEQDIPVEEEIDVHDPVSEHALATNPAGTAIATGRLLPDGHIGRMAVLSEWRGRGVGAAVLRSLVARAIERGCDAVQLSAQIHAQHFYSRFGFVPHGPTYLDVGIPHIAMSLKLNSPA